MDCDDKDPCTIDGCKNFACQFVNTCCFSDAECDDQDDVCTQDKCIQGKCVYSATGVEGCCLVPYFEDDFSQDKGWEYGPSPAVQDNSWVYVNLKVQQYTSSKFRFRIGFNIMQGGVYTTGSWNIDDVKVLDATAMSGSPLCCKYQSDCQGLYSPAACSGGTCEVQ